MIKHKYTAKPWKTPIDDPIFFDVEFVLYRQNSLLIVLLDARNNQKYSISVSGKVHLRYIHDNYRFSIWSYPEWQKLIQNGFTCGILTNSNFQLSIIDSKNMLNYFLITDSDGFEILTPTEPLILPINNEIIDNLICDFMHNKDIENASSSTSNKKIKPSEMNQLIKYSNYESILQNASLHFEMLIVSNKGGNNFIVKDHLSGNRYRIMGEFRCAFQCIQSPDHASDYSTINEFTKELKKPVSPLWKLDSSQLLTETIDLEICYDINDFGSLYIKTDDAEIECVTKNPPQISLESKELSDLIKNILL